MHDALARALWCEWFLHYIPLVRRKIARQLSRFSLPGALCVLFEDTEDCHTNRNRHEEKVLIAQVWTYIYSVELIYLRSLL